MLMPVAQPAMWNLQKGLDIMEAWLSELEENFHELKGQ
jgi:ABC-type sugar transport system substrate-binding protein